jgi:hypothetical protein
MVYDFQEKEISPLNLFNIGQHIRVLPYVF